MEALSDQLEKGKFAASGGNNQSTLITTWTRFNEMAFTEGTLVLPLTELKYRNVAALFKAAPYRSFSNYAAAIKAHHIQSGYAWTDLLSYTARWARRSVLRGIGPARQSAPLRLDRLMALPMDLEPFSEDGPLRPVTLTR